MRERLMPSKCATRNWSRRRPAKSGVTWRVRVASSSRGRSIAEDKTASGMRPRFKSISFCLEGQAHGELDLALPVKCGAVGVGDCAELRLIGQPRQGGG